MDTCTAMVHLCNNHYMRPTPVATAPHKSYKGVLVGLFQTSKEQVCGMFRPGDTEWFSGVYGEDAEDSFLERTEKVEA